MTFVCTFCFLLLVFVFAAMLTLFLIPDDNHVKAAKLVYNSCYSCNTNQIQELQKLSKTFNDAENQNFFANIYDNRLENCIILQVLHVASQLSPNLMDAINDKYFKTLLVFNSIQMLENVNPPSFKEINTFDFISMSAKAWENFNHTIMLHKNSYVLDKPPDQRMILSITDSTKLFSETELTSVNNLVFNAIKIRKKRLIFLKYVKIHVTSFARIHPDVSKALNKNLYDADVLRKRLIEKNIYPVSESSNHSNQKVENWSKVVLVSKSLLEDVSTITLDTPVLKKETKKLLLSSEAFEFMLRGLKLQDKSKQYAVPVSKAIAELLKEAENAAAFTKLTGRDVIKVELNGQYIEKSILKRNTLALIRSPINDESLCLSNDRTPVLFTKNDKSRFSCLEINTCIQNLEKNGKIILNHEGSVVLNDEIFNQDTLCISKNVLDFKKNNLQLNQVDLTALDTYPHFQKLIIESKNFAHVDNLKILQGKKLRNVLFIQKNGEVVNCEKEGLYSNLLFTKVTFLNEFKFYSMKLSSQNLEIISQQHAWNYYLNNLKINEDFFEIHEDFRLIQRMNSFLNKVSKLGFERLDSSFVFAKSTALFRFKNRDPSDFEVTDSDAKYLYEFKPLRDYVIRNIASISLDFAKPNEFFKTFFEHEISQNNVGLRIIGKDGTLNYVSDYTFAKDSALKILNNKHLMDSFTLKEHINFRKFEAVRKYYYRNAQYTDSKFELSQDLVFLLCEYNEFDLFQNLMKQRKQQLVFYKGGLATNDNIQPKSIIFSVPEKYLNREITMFPVEGLEKDEVIRCSFFHTLITASEYSDIHPKIVYLINLTPGGKSCFFKMLDYKRLVLVSAAGIQKENHVIRTTVVVAEDVFKLMNHASVKRNTQFMELMKSNILRGYFCNIVLKNSVDDFCE